jgi:hypothetical protein
MSDDWKKSKRSGRLSAAINVCSNCDQGALLQKNCTLLVMFSFELPLTIFDLVNHVIWQTSPPFIAKFMKARG